MATRLIVSASREDTARLLLGGPRRDFVELAEATGGEAQYRDGSPRKGIRGKLLGPHLRQAWHAAKRAEPGDVLFADGEHIGLPLAVFAGILRRRARVVMLGHLVSRRWKLPLAWLATRLIPGGALVLHSVEQERAVRRWCSRSWDVLVAPYQVDTEFWRSQRPPEGGSTPLIVAVGAENRDYATLIEAVRGLPVCVVIAGGSHWARTEAAGGESLPENITFLREPLGFLELRDLYERATAVVVPLHDVSNQSGITVLLEAMSMSRPVIVTASRGQRECVRGPLVTAGEPGDIMPDRGPQVLGLPEGDVTGWYVPPTDVVALRAAIEGITSDRDLAERLGKAGRATVERSFRLESFTATLSVRLTEPSGRLDDAPALVPTEAPTR